MGRMLLLLLMWFSAYVTLLLCSSELSCGVQVAFFSVQKRYGNGRFRNVMEMIDLACEHVWVFNDCMF